MTLFKHTFILLFSPTLFWVAVTAAGFGAQSLANLIEIPVVLTISLGLAVIPERWISYRAKMAIAIAFVLLLRMFMPVLPE
jgi:hypothetical protein